MQHYREALLKGYAIVKESSLLLKRDIILEQNDAGVRKQSATVLKNQSTGEVVFEPPQEYETIQKLLDNLEKYINEENEIDPLVNMAMVVLAGL